MKNKIPNPNIYMVSYKPFNTFLHGIKPLDDVIGYKIMLGHSEEHVMILFDLEYGGKFEAIAAYDIPEDFDGDILNAL